MASRMERYYQNNNNCNRRTEKNKEIYRTIYDDKGYDNVDTSSFDTGKEIDLEELKALIHNSDDDDNSIVKKEEKKVESNIDSTDEEHVYDIHDMLDEAKKNHPEEKKNRCLAETQVFTLQELVNSKDYSNKSKLDKNEVKDLINTIYNTNMLQSDDGDGLLDSLRSTGNTVVSTSIHEAVINAKNKDNDEQEDTIDKSFYTSSLGFKQSDFEDKDSSDIEIEKSNKVTIIFLVILGLLFVASIIYVIIKYGKA